MENKPYHWLNEIKLSNKELKESDIGRVINWRRTDTENTERPYFTGQHVIKSFTDNHVTISLINDPIFPDGSSTPRSQVTFTDEEEELRQTQNLLKNLKEDNKLNMSANTDSKMKLKGLNETTVVHCTTQKEADAVCAIAHKAGLKWLNGKSYETDTKWSVRGEKSCYVLTEGMIHSVDYFKNEGFTILTAKKFIEINNAPEIPNVELTPEQYSFNLDRLAKETDTVVKGQLDKAKESLKQESVNVAVSVIKDLKERVQEVQESVHADFKVKVSDVLENSKEMLLEELRKGRTTINVGIGEIASSYSISTDDHYMMETVFKSLLLHKKIMLAGEAGTGKTYMGSSMADKLKLPFYKYSCSRDSSVHDLLGYKQPRSETYLTTTFLNAYENGGIFLVDEYDAMPGDVALFFNGVADSSKSISVPHRDTNPIAKKHKNFYLIMCGNTWGKGSQDYSGRDFQDMALLDRFRLCRHHIGYDKKLEISMVGETMYPFVEAMRNKLTQIGSYLSTRNVEDIGLLLRSGEDLAYVVKTISADLEETDKQEFSRANLATSFDQAFKKFKFDYARLEEIELKKAKK